MGVLALAAAVSAAALGAMPLGSAAKVPPFSFVGGGDIALVGRTSSSKFAGIRRYLHGDLVMANLEGTLASGRRSRSALPRQRRLLHVPRRPVVGVMLRRAGFNVLNVANNHALDYGAEGAGRETLAALRAAPHRL